MSTVDHLSRFSGRVESRRSIPEGTFVVIETTARREYAARVVNDLGDFIEVTVLEVVPNTTILPGDLRTWDSDRVRVPAAFEVVGEWEGNHDR